jgi:hypothetical protein
MAHRQCTTTAWSLAGSLAAVPAGMAAGPQDGPPPALLGLTALAADRHP